MSKPSAKKRLHDVQTVALVQVLQPAGHAAGVAVSNQYPSFIALQCPASGAEHVLQPVSQLMQVLVVPSGI